MLNLRIQPPDGDAYEVSLATLPVTIGRSARSDLRLDDPFASRLHAELRQDGDGLRLSDLGSGNGTLVNDRRIGTNAPLRPGDSFRIGNTLLSVTSALGEAAPAPAEDGAAGGSSPSSAAAPLDPAAESGESTREGDVAPEEGEAADFVARPETLRSEAVAPGPTPYSAVVEAVRQAAGSAGPDTAAHGYELFGVINRVGAALLSPASLPEVLNQILDLVFEAVAAERAYLLLREPSGELVCKVASFRGGEPPAGETQCRISRSILERVVEQGEPVLVTDALEDERFLGSDSIIASGMRSLMAVPLAIGERVLGMVQVDTPAAVGAFHRDDLAMLHTLAAIAAIKIDNAVLVEERLDNERMRQELASAREIQARLLPETPPALPSYEVAGATLPCGEVGGDYFDFLELDGGVLLFAVGDVTGKGLDAALLMSSVHASIHTLVAAGTGAAELVGRLNRFLCVNVPDNRFVTLFLAELDPASHRLRYFNAGHNPPLLVRRAGDVEPLASASLPLGIDPTSVCQPAEVELEPGDVLLVYSDGVTEAVNEAGEEFGSAPLVELPRTYPTAQAWELQQLVDDRLRTFMDRQPQADDMTLVVLRRRPSA